MKQHNNIKLYDTTSISLGEARAGDTAVIILRAGDEATNFSRNLFSAFSRASVVACLMASLYGPLFFLL